METEFLFLVGFVHLPAAEILISCNLLPGSLCCWTTQKYKELTMHKSS